MRRHCSLYVVISGFRKSGFAAQAVCEKASLRRGSACSSQEPGESELFVAFERTRAFLVPRATSPASRTAGPSTPLSIPFGEWKATVGMTLTGGHASLDVQLKAAPFKTKARARFFNSEVRLTGS